MDEKKKYSIVIMTLRTMFRNGDVTITKLQNMKKDKKITSEEYQYIITME